MIKQNIGLLVLNFTVFGHDSYKISWLSKLTQVTTTLHKVDKANFSIHREWKQKKHVENTLIEEFKVLKLALSYFLTNTDTFKVSKDIVTGAKQQVMDWIEQVECMHFNFKPTLSKAQSRIGFPVLVGVDQEREGIVLKMLPPETPNKRPMVELKLTNGPQSGRVVRVATDRVWIE